MTFSFTKYFGFTDTEIEKFSPYISCFIKKKQKQKHLCETNGCKWVFYYQIDTQVSSIC